MEGGGILETIFPSFIVYQREMSLPSSSHDNGDKVNVTLSVGGTKIGAGVVNRSGEVVVKVKAVPTSYGSPSLFDDIVAQIAKVMDRVDIRDVMRIGVSFPECVFPPKRVVADPENLPPVKNPIQERIEEMVFKELGMKLEVEVIHDAAAAILGEVSPKGTLPYCKNAVFVVWGTGIASGIVCNGKLYWRDPVIDRMTGEIGHLVIRNMEGIYEYRLTPKWLKLSPPEESLDHRLCGPALTRRFSQKIKEDPRGQIFLRAAGEAVYELADINSVARQGNDFAIELIEEAGREMGEALAPFVHYWRGKKMDFVNNIIIGSGVAEMGRGLEKAGKGILITAIRNGITEGLTELGIDDYDTNNVILSKIGYEREFLAFIPAR